MDDLVNIARLLNALHPWLPHIVVVGGWAHRLHRLLPLAHAPTYQPLRTPDADLALAGTAHLHGNISESLTSAGFREHLSGEHRPPVSEYRLGDADSGFYAEFLTPLAGSGTRRDGTPNATVRTAGITAQRLRYLELLLVNPWTIELAPSAALPLDATMQVQLANPVSFIAQKLLIRAQRTPNKQAQDILYIHDTLDLFGQHLPALQTTWWEALRPTLRARDVDHLHECCQTLFTQVSDTIREAARMPQDRVLTPDRLRAACAYGLPLVFSREAPTR